MLATVTCLGALLVLAAARAIPDQPQSQMDLVRNGPYTIVNCGAANAAKIATSLKNLGTYLTPAIQDAQNSAKSPSPAYTTFFKDRTSAPYISNLFTNVTTGPPAYAVNHFSNGSPIFACLQGPGQMTYKSPSTQLDVDAFITCQQNSSLASFIVTGTAYIAVCPNFFTTRPVLPAQPPGYATSVPAPRPGIGASNCLMVSQSTNQFGGDGSTLTSYMPWLLLEEIVHYYIAATPAGEAEGPGVQTYDPNKCMGLSPQRAVQSAHNFVYYVASIYGQCTAFPTAIPNSRDTLETTPPPLAGTIPSTFPAGIINGTHLTFGGYGDSVVTSAQYY